MAAHTSGRGVSQGAMPNHGLICRACGTEWPLQRLRDAWTGGGLVCPGCGGGSIVI